MTSVPPTPDQTPDDDSTSIVPGIGDLEPDPEPRRRTRRRPSVLGVLGLVLLLSGLGCLGWVGYQYFGTNVVSQRAYNQEVDQLRASWDTPTTTKDGKKATKPTVVPGDAIALLRIPALGRNFEVPILEGTDLDTLSRGVGHYEKTAKPGQIGNFAIAGHRVTHGQPFSKLLELKVGDTIVVETRAAIYTYTLDTAPSQLTVQDTAGWVIQPNPENPDEKATQKRITLTTCQDLFHSPDRSVGFGLLTDVVKKKK